MPYLTLSFTIVLDTYPGTEEDLKMKGPCDLLVWDEREGPCDWETDMPAVSTTSPTQGWRRKKADHSNPQPQFQEPGKSLSHLPNYLKCNSGKNSQDGRGERPDLTSSHGHIKNHNAEQAIEGKKKRPELPEKFFYNWKPKEETTRHKGGWTWEIIKSHYWLGGGDPQLGSNYIAEIFPQDWGFWAPCHSHQPRTPAPRRRAPQSIYFEGQCGLIPGTPQDWGKWRLHF